MTRFQVIHAMHLHPPYGTWIVRHKGIEIGRQISRPSTADCEDMLRTHLLKSIERASGGEQSSGYSYHLSGLEATRRSQRRGGYHKRGKRQATKP